MKLHEKRPIGVIHVAATGRVVAACLTAANDEDCLNVRAHGGVGQQAQRAFQAVADMDALE